MIYGVLCYFQTVYKWDTLKVIFDDFFFGIVSFFIIAVASENGFVGVSKFILENPLVVRIGKISYGMYIIHLFIPSLFYFLLPKLNIAIDNKWAVFFVMYGMAFLIASLSWTLIEKPINRLKEKFGYVENR
jgi:peptidoglycan/LPS O-acetylase OafA/YrhL